MQKVMIMISNRTARRTRNCIWTSSWNWLWRWGKHFCPSAEVDWCSEQVSRCSLVQKKNNEIIVNRCLINQPLFTIIINIDGVISNCWLQSFCNKNNEDYIIRMWNSNRIWMLLEKMNKSIEIVKIPNRDHWLARQ